MRGLANEQKRRAIFDFHRSNADLLIIQETHSCTDNEQYWTNEWGGKAIFSHGTTAARGIAIFTSKVLFSKMKNIYTDMDGRTIILDLEQNGTKISIAAIYAPNQDTPAYFTNIRNLMSGRHEHKIIVGDFNLAMDAEMDRLNTYCNNNKARDEVLNMADEFCLKDIWRIQHIDSKIFSWKCGNNNKASRIDFALVSGGLDQSVKTSTYISSIKTDHRAFYMVIELSAFERGTGYWKFNNTLLSNQEFLSLMNKEIQNCIACGIEKDPGERWEIIKKRIRKTSKAFTRNRQNENQLIICQLSEKLNDYESRLPLNREENNLMQETRTELEELVMEKTKGIMFRSKAKWYEEGERNTKYFFSLEKAKYNAKTCYRILNEEQQEIEDPYQILEYQRNFYEKLYDRDEDVSFNLKNNYGITVPSNIKHDQDQPITQEEIQAAIKTMNNNKTPGSDGIPVDFYKVFWNQLRQPFTDMAQHAFNTKILHQSAREGILNLIPKAGKDTRIIKNLRPITLLNTDYKIIEKAIANKMLPALEHIIHKDQRGFMKNRRISVNIRKMLDIMHQVESEDLEAVILSLDFVKCFDKCSFSILHGSLDFFGFGETVKEWTKILYNSFYVKIQNNGHFSRSINIKKGVHQGGCCSSVYFLVIAEILALSLRNNQNIDGITLADIRNLLNQFADDTDIFSLCNEKSIKEIFKELDNFRYQSGFMVSYEKTSLYRIGSLRHSNAQMYGMDKYVWTNEDISVLGVTIAHENIVEKNYQELISKTKGVLNAWYNRGLSLIGKVQVVNTLVASLFVYKMMVLPTIPNSTIKNLDNIIREFLWNGKKAKIAYGILQNPKKKED